MWIRRDEGDERIWNVTIYKSFDDELSSIVADRIDVHIVGNEVIDGRGVSFYGYIQRSTLAGTLHFMTGFVTNFDMQGEFEFEEVESIRRIRFSKSRL